MFYLDVSIPQDKSVFDGAIDTLKKRTEDFYFLGSYRAAP
jgi:prephenate dehydratase